MPLAIATRAHALRTRVLLVDDHAVVRVGFRLLLEQSADIAVVAEAGDVDAAYRSYVAEQPDVVIMDIGLPGASGTEGIRRILARDRGARVLAFSMHEDDVIIERALTAGARGYVSKASAADVLVEAVQKIAQGGQFLEPPVAARMVRRRAQGIESPFSALSMREFEIALMLANGLATHEVGRRLNIAPKTVGNYTAQIKTKLDIGTLPELTRLAIRYKLIDP
jgi:two-component system invasion response regulator UvrY